MSGTWGMTLGRGVTAVAAGTAPVGGGMVIAAVAVPCVADVVGAVTAEPEPPGGRVGAGVIAPERVGAAVASLTVGVGVRTTVAGAGEAVATVGGAGVGVSVVGTGVALGSVSVGRVVRVGGATVGRKVGVPVGRGFTATTTDVGSASCAALCRTDPMNAAAIVT